MQAPTSEADLLDRAKGLSGVTLGALAARLGCEVPTDLRRAKGWVGELLERALGATAGSRAAPDFEALGIELKSLPVTPDGRPLETTFVCTIALLDMQDTEWEASRVLAKLRRVLWVPVEGMRQRAVAERRIGAAVLWSPSPEEEQDLRFDWEELSGWIGRGDVESVTGHLGRYLQVRPKARNSRARRRGLDADGAAIATLPRGFYLRTSFTARILAAHFALGRRGD